MSKIATRDGFGDEIVELGRENKNILVVDVDIGKSCKTTNFAKQLPAQHVNVGIAEQSGAGVAAGLATCGKIPFVVTYAAFGSMRMCEMIRQEICYPHLNVKIACSHGGVTPANDGASHQCIEDMGILSTIPGMTVIMQPVSSPVQPQNLMVPCISALRAMLFPRYTVPSRNLSSARRSLCAREPMRQSFQ